MSESYNLMQPNTDPNAQPKATISPNPASMQGAGLSIGTPSATQAQEPSSQPQTQTPATTSLYSSANSTVSPQDLQKVGFDLNVEQNQQAKSSLSMATQQDEIIENIVKQATNTQETEKAILQDLEQMDASLELALPVQSKEQTTQKAAKMFFVFSAIIAAIALVYYVGTSQELVAFSKIDYVTESQKKLVSVQTDKVLNHYLLAAIAYDDLAVKASKFNYAYKYESPARINQTQQDLLQVMTTINQNLTAAAKDQAANPDILTELNLKLVDERKKFLDLANKEDDPVKKSSFESLSQLYLSASKLSRNQQVRQVLAQTESVTQDPTELLAVTEQALALNDTNPVAKVALVELSRTNWTDIFDEIQTITEKFDPNFNVFKNSEEYMVAFTNYTFNSDSGTVGVTGEVKTGDSKTFTLIADLMDALEASPKFKDLRYTTFTKNYSEDGSAYTSTLNLNFLLESRDKLLALNPTK